MLQWLAENLATILISFALLLIVAAIISGMRRDKKRGKSACGCSCAGCPNCGACHQAQSAADGGKRVCKG